MKSLHRRLRQRTPRNNKKDTLFWLSSTTKSFEPKYMKCTLAQGRSLQNDLYPGLGSNGFGQFFHKIMIKQKQMSQVCISEVLIRSGADRSRILGQRSTLFLLHEVLKYQRTKPFVKKYCGGGLLFYINRVLIRRDNILLRTHAAHYILAWFCSQLL